MMPQISPENFKIPGALGPYSTFANHGYESLNMISPVIPQPYDAVAPPGFLGVQFVRDSPRNLALDHFRLTVSDPKGKVATGKIIYTANGFVGVRPIRELVVGSYRVRFVAPGFQTPVSVWQIRVKRWKRNKWKKLRPYEANASKPSYLLNFLR